MEDMIYKAARNAIHDAISTELIGYKRPLSILAGKVIDSHADELCSLIDGEVSALINSTKFKIEFRQALSKKLASVLINRMGGELEKKVNLLKANPETGAKLTLAITKLVDDIIGG